MVSIIKDNDFKMKANIWTDDEDDERARFTEGNNYFVNYILHPISNRYNDEFVLTQTTCRMGGVEQIRLEKRNSHTFNWRYNIHSHKVNDFLQRNGLHPLDYGKITYSHCYDWEGSYVYKSNFELIKYGQGGLFVKHKDKLEGGLTCKDIHTHMCLLYPPAHLSPFEGGDIVFYLKNYIGEETEHIIKPSKFEDWTFLIFEQQTMHEVTPVTKGVRYVYKAPIYKTNPYCVKMNEDDLES